MTACQAVRALTTSCPQDPGTESSPGYTFGAKLTSVRTLHRSNDPQLKAPEKVCTLFVCILCSIGLHSSILCCQTVNLFLDKGPS